MRYLVTGGAGFIGSHLADALVERGDEVVALDDISTGALANIAHLADRPDFTFVEGTTLDPDLVEKLVVDTDVIVHLAAAVGVRLIVEHPLESIITNIRGTEHVLAAAAALHRRILIASTSEVYGKNSYEPLKEDADRILGSPFIARWSYSTTKTVDEILAHAYWRERGTPAIVARLFNCVGPRQTGDYGMVLPTFVRQAVLDEPITVHGTGLQRRCFCHIDDTVAGLLALMDHPDSPGDPFNVGALNEVAIIDLAAMVRERTGSSSRIVRIPYDVAYEQGFEDMERRVPDLGKIRALTGWEPTRSLEDILDDVIAHERAASAVSGVIGVSHSFLYTAAFVVSFLATIVLTPLAAKVAARAGLVDQPREGRFHGTPTPFLGGVAVVGGLLLVAALAAGASGKLLVVLLGALTLGAVGLVDDVRHLGPVVRLAFEGGAALALWIVGIRAGIFGNDALDLVLTVVWVIAIVNAVNMVDNMDGLAGGVTMVSALGIAVVAGLQGEYLMAPFALAVAGASAGFLVFNFPPARIFLGDAGSMALGFLLAALGLQLDLVAPHPLAQPPSPLARAVILVLLVAVPLFDLVVVVIARILRRDPPWLGATDHTSHRLAQSGVSHRGVAAAFLGAQLVCSAIAVFVYRHPSTALPVAIATAVIALVGVVLVLRMPHPAKHVQPAWSPTT